jgi:hypothetical protein
MLQELTAASGVQVWAIGSLLFFAVVFASIAVRVISRGASHYERHSRLPLEELASDEHDGVR